jgi:hypothetical protein
MRIPALTICQPHAFYASLPESDPRHKRIENRSRPLPGLPAAPAWFAIHAGKSRDWLGTGDFPFVEGDLAFGAVIALAHARGWWNYGLIRANEQYREEARRILADPHTCGPWCLLFGGVVRLAEPYPCRGYQGIWQVDIPASVCNL